MSGPVKAVFFDIDGTLLDHAHGSVMPASTAESLKALRKKGIKVFLATGRFPGTLGSITEMFPFDGFVTMNGQLAVDSEGKVLHRMPHRTEAVLGLLEVLKKDPFPALLIEENACFSHTACPEVELHFRWLDLPIPTEYDPARLKDHPVLQFLAYIPWEERYRLRDIPYAVPTCAGGNILDVIPQGGGKEKGIEAAAACYGIGRDQVMVFGDGINDASMIGWAGYGVAMGNGAPEAKAAADYVTAPIWEDGVRKALLYFEVLTEHDLT